MPQEPPAESENENPEARSKTLPPVQKYIQQTLYGIIIESHSEDNPRGGVLPQNESPQESLKILHPNLKKKIEIAEHKENIQGGVLPHDHGRKEEYQNPPDKRNIKENPAKPQKILPWEGGS